MLAHRACSGSERETTTFSLPATAHFLVSSVNIDLDLDPDIHSFKHKSSYTRYVLSSKRVKISNLNTHPQYNIERRSRSEC